MSLQLHVTGLYFVGFLTSLLLSVGLTYMVRERARTLGLFDPVDARKLHTTPIPRVGGVAIVLAVALSLALVTWLLAISGRSIGGGGLRAVLIGALSMHLLGLWDDLRPLKARFKLLGQIAIAGGVFAAGVRMETLSLPFAGIVELGPWWGFAFTIFWLVGVTNAFNLIDGLDGLASGAALFALTTMFVVGSINGQEGAALVSLVVAGATIGFLLYNWHPASIFLGDSGSLFLGFTLAVMGLVSSQKGSTVVAVAIPVVSLGLPVLDTLLSIVRRFLRGQPIFTPDRGHIHHRMLGLGHSPRNVALLMYGACAALALSGMLMVNNSLFVALFLTLVGIGFGVWVQKLRFHEFEELARVVRRGLRSRDVIARRVRIREASTQLALVSDLGLLFSALEQTFSDDEFERAEVRLRPSFLQAVAPDPTVERLATRRHQDDVTVWSWSRTGTAMQPQWWELKLPFVDARGDRIGSLVLWQDGMASETSLSHVQAIGGEFRAEVQRKLLTLWPHPEDDRLAPAIEEEVERLIAMVAGARGGREGVPEYSARRAVSTRVAEPARGSGSSAA